MGGISARPSARYSGITMDSDLNVTREASCDKQLSLRGILLSSFIFVPSLWILSASFVASLSLFDLGKNVSRDEKAPGGHWTQRPALYRQEVSNCCPAITSQWRSGEDQNKTFPVCCSYSHCCISITLVSNLFTRAIHQNSTFTPTS